MLLYSQEAKIVGLAKESSRLVAESAPTKWLAVDKSSDLAYGVKVLADTALRGVKAPYAGYPGLKELAGKMVSPARANVLPDFLQMILGAPVTTEQSMVTVSSGVNDKIDFIEDSGTEVTATLTAGSYPIGASSATAGTFCKLIKDQLEAANGTSETYTVIYSTATRKFTVTKSSGVFVILWKTGTNTLTCAAALLGFTTAADTGSAIAQTSASAVNNRVFKHVFSGPPSSVQPTTYTFFIDRGLSIKAYNGCAVKKMSLACPEGDFLNHESEMLGISEAPGAIGSPSYTSDLEPLSFQHVLYKVGGVTETEIKNFTLEIDSKAFGKRIYNQSQDVADILAAARMEISGGFDIYFTSEDERTKFLATTVQDLEIIAEGNAMTGVATKDSIDIIIPEIQYQAYPFDYKDDLLAASVKFSANYNVATSKMIEIDVVNLTSSY